MKTSIAILMCVVALFIGVGYVSADAGGMAKVRELALKQALASNGAAFDLYPCTTAVEFGSVYIEKGCNAWDAVDGDISRLVNWTYVDGPVDTNVLGGIFRVRYDVTNSRGIPAESAVRRVVVVDTRPPVIELLGCDEF